MKKKLTEIKSVEYDVAIEEKPKKQPDLELLVRFIQENKHESMAIEYADNREAQLRRMCLRTWLCKSGYSTKYYTVVRLNKLYILKEKGSVDLSTK